MQELSQRHLCKSGELVAVEAWPSKGEQKESPPGKWITFPSLVPPMPQQCHSSIACMCHAEVSLAKIHRGLGQAQTVPEVHFHS